MKDPKAVAVILGRLSKEKPDEKHQEGGGYAAAAEEVMSALKSGDVEGFSSALKSFVTMCQAEG